MRRAHGISAAALLAAAFLASAIGVDAQAGSWLDAPPRAFNAAGMAVPKAPPSVTPAGDRCRGQERPAATPEEAQLAAAGWRLESYWRTPPTVGDVAVVLALADYDGMCRPASFNGFAFAGGRFAGTISPESMVSRQDGVLVDPPSVGADGRVTAGFTRYAPSDPLCCPSRGRTVVTYRLERSSAGPTLVPERLVATAAAAAPLAAGVSPPTQLPRTGGVPPELLVGLAGALIAAGLALRWRQRRS
jgi:hypothetical protein